MRNNREISLWLSLFMSISLFSFSQNQYPFIENKGQLPQTVYSKVKVPSGAIFIEKGKFTYSFYNGEQLKEKHDLQRTENWIDGHSFSANFINPNENIEVILSEKSSYFENFYNSEKENLKKKKKLILIKFII